MPRLGLSYPSTSPDSVKKYSNKKHVFIFLFYLALYPFLIIFSYIIIIYYS
jgi:hypothetical protein